MIYKKLLSLRFLFRTALLCLSLSTILPPLSFAEDIKITSTFDKRAAQVGEEIHLVIRIAGAQGNIQAPRLPGFKGFDTFYTGRASHITFINGQSSSSIEFSYSLVPKEAGRFRLDPIEVTIEGRRFVTEPVEIEITGAASAGRTSYTSQNAPFNPNRAPSQTAPSNAAPSSAGQPSGGQEPAAAFVPGDDNIFVRAWVDKNTVYPNEQVLLNYSLYTNYDTRYEGFDKEPQISGFWIEEFPMERDVRRETVTMNGKRYMKADVKMMALFPTTPADYTIDPGVLKASIRQEARNNSAFDEFFNDSFFSGGGFFARRETRLLKPPPIQITVKPFPEQGKPASFQGAVGNFKLTGTVDKQSVKQNEPVTFTMVIEGEGNIETLNKPAVPELKEFKIYDADSSSQLFKTGNVIGGRKTFEIIYIPIKAGQLKIPKQEFSFFNPARGAYVTLNTPEFNLTVTPSEQQFKLPKGMAPFESDQLKKQVTMEGKDIRYIWEKLPESQQDFYVPLAVKGFFVVNLAAFIGVILGSLRRRQESVYAKDTALKRRKFARARAEGAMRKLRKKDANYFDEAEKILTQYLSDKFNLSAYGMTRYDLEAQLHAVLGEGDALMKDIREFYHVCDESRFGKGAVPEALKEKALVILKETISRVERMKPLK